MSTNLQSVLADREYKNWLRAGLSLKYARQGILNLVKNDIDNFHQDLVNNLLAGSQCSNCSTENIVPCRNNNNFCRFANRTCKVHVQTDPNKKCKNCPNSVCDQIYTEIVKEHRYTPTWRNTDCHRWCNQAWQLAVCYMPEGYASKVTAAATDLPGLLNVIINNRRFHNLVNDNMGNKSNIFCQAREVRNTILHKGNMRITDTDLANYIQTLQTMLSDPKCSSTDPDMQEAYTRLTEIQNGSLFVTTEDIDEIKAEACKAIEEKKQEALSAVKQSKEEAEKDIKQTADDACLASQKVIEDRTQKAMTDLSSATDVHVNKLRVEAEAIKQTSNDAKKVLGENKQEALSAVTSQEDVSAASVKKAGVETIEKAEIAIKNTADTACSVTKKVIEDQTQKVMTDLSSETDVHVNKLRVEAEAIKQTSNDAKKVIEDQTQKVMTDLSSETDVHVNKLRVEAEAIKQTSNDAKKVIEDQTQKVMTDLSSETDVHINKLRVEAEAIKQTSNDAKKVIEEKKQDILSELSSVAAANKAGVKAESAIQKHQPQDAGMTDNFGNNKKSVKVMDASRTSFWKKIKARLGIKKTPQDAGVTDDSVTRNRKALQKHLISTYQEELSTPLFPVVQIDDVNIEELYVQPNMKLIDPQKEPNDKGVPINSYQDIFRDERKKKIYILGDAGMGKTSLCKKIVSVWCTVHSNTIDNMSKDQLAMSKFDFLFYISLRDTVSIKKVKEMITDQLELERFQEQLQEILENDKCLVILDGLDEWTTENTDARSSSINKGIPGRQGITNCTVLTTTRPSKFEAIQLKTTQIDTKVELLGIEKKTSEKLIETIIGFLNAKYGNHKTKRECLSKLEQSDLSCFLSIPVILKQLICLWYFGKHLGTTKCAIYSQMFELHLDMAESRLTGDPEYETKKEELMNSKVKLPSCFDENPKCQQFKPLIVALSNISFETLVSDNQESSLIFNRSQAEFYGLTSQDINICLKIGILSQNKIMVDLFQKKKLSFLHKTFQEFLAALFVFNNQSNPEKFTQLRKTDKEFDLNNVIPFISGMCSSETTCRIVNSCDKINQTTLEHCLKEGWRCNHDNKHLQCDNIEINTEHQPEPLELLCQANIHHMKRLTIYSSPTARCLEYLLQVDTLEVLHIGSWFSSPISEDNLYSLIHHNTHTLTYLDIWEMTLQSRTQLPKLLYNIQHLSQLDIYCTTMSQHLQDSLQELKAQRPDIVVNIRGPTILPDTECTD